ncbi:MAG: sigma-70 family RNA polymerase sigma factor [Anaerolineales bacterium]|nr:sigma-70 family RNA polymerase sigma factor [Anaerolineales bacterium]
MKETRDAFAALVVAHQKLIYKVCHLYADDPADVEDLFQEIVLNLWRAYPRFDGRSRITTWMYRVGLNTAISQLRKTTRRRRHEVHADPGGLAAGPPPPDDQARQLRAAIRQLDDVEKAIVLLYLEDHSYAEIAAVVGISTNYVGVQLNRIKQKLRRLTREASDGP